VKSKNGDLYADSHKYFEQMEEFLLSNIECPLL